MSTKKAVLLVILTLILGISLGVGGTMGLMEYQSNEKEQENEISEITNSVSVVNPVAGMSYEEALAIAAELGEGKNVGSWRTMTGEEFMEWWRSSNNINDEN